MSNKRTRTVNRANALPPSEPGLAAEQPDEELDAEADEQPTQPVRPQPRATGAQPKGAAQPMSAESLTRSVLFCLGGLILGFALGFFLANKMSVEPRPQSAAARTTQAADRAAPPPDPSQATDQLPPRHPDVGSKNGPIGSEGPHNPHATTAE